MGKVHTAQADSGDCDFLETLKASRHKNPFRTAERLCIGMAGYGAMHSKETMRLVVKLDAINSVVLLHHRLQRLTQGSFRLVW